MSEHEFDQIIKVRSNEYDGDETGREWRIHYVVYRTRDDDGRRCFDLYEDDGHGNGDMLCRFYKEARARQIAIKLGELIEYAAGQAPKRFAA